MNRTSKKVRYAVVGLGNIAQVAILPAFKHAAENSELVGLVSSDARKRDELGKRYGVSVTGTYDDFEAVVERSRADAVFIALPNSMHREATERAAARRLHVLCEKPLAVTEEDCRAMIAACEAQDVKLMTAYRLHFEEGNLEAIRIVRDGELGEARFFSSVFAHQVRAGNIRTRAELGGGALFDLGIYCLNAARYIFGAEPVEVFAHQVFGHDDRSRDVDEMTTAVLRFPGDRTAQFTCSQGATDVAEYRVVGTKGELQVEPAYEYAGPIRHTLTIGEKRKEKTFRQRDQFAPELLHFSSCILNGTDPEPDGREGLVDVAILQAIAASARAGRPMQVRAIDHGRRPSPNQSVRKPPVGKLKTVNAPSPSK